MTLDQLLCYTCRLMGPIKHVNVFTTASPRVNHPKRMDPYWSHTNKLGEFYQNPVYVDGSRLLAYRLCGGYRP